MNASDIFAKVFQIGYTIYDAERARRRARQRSFELKETSERVTSMLPSTETSPTSPSKSENPESLGGGATQTSQEPITREISGEKSHSKPPLMVKERKDLDPATMAWQLKQTRADLWEIESHLKNKCRACGAANDCCWKHSQNLINIATETKSMTTDPLWGEIIELGEEIKVKAHPENIKTGKYFDEFPALVLQASELRRRIDNELIELEKPELTLEEAKAEAAKLAEEEVEKLWESQITNSQDTMFFNVPEAREYLLKTGLVYTLRPKMRKVGKDTAFYGTLFKKEKIGPIWVDFIKEVKEPREVQEYVSDSGFETVEDWWEAAEGSRFLFKVRLK